MSFNDLFNQGPDPSSEFRAAESTILFYGQGFDNQSIPEAMSTKQKFSQMRQPTGDDSDCSPEKQFKNQNDTSYFDSKQVSPDFQKTNLQKQLLQSMMASKQMRQQPLKNLRNGSQTNDQEQEQDYYETVLNFNGIKASIFEQEDELEQSDDVDLEMQKQSIILLACLSTHKKEEPIIIMKKEGMLYKKSKKLFVNYQLSHCVLEGRMLKCYKRKYPQRAKCVLNFDIFHFQYQSKVVDGVTKEFSLNAVGSEMVFAFKGQTQEETTEWFDKIKQMVDESLTLKTKDKTYFLSSFNGFWKKHLINEIQFRKQANSGDLILFRGSSMNCRLQRLLTGSEYDHVGLVLNQGNGQLFVLEATGSSGVGLFSWDVLIKNRWYELYDKIILRKLVHKKTQTFYTQLEEFILMNMGKDYKLSISKIMRNNSTILDKSAAQSDRTYFCSELVAAAYKKLQLLPQEKSCTQYWPGSFSNEKVDLVLLNGAHLSDEYLIGFNM